MEQEAVRLCHDCPRQCHVPRPQRAEPGQRIGICGMGDLPVVAKAMLHRWEEPCISGSHGSGTIFFSGCNLHCVYCQNAKISHGRFGMVLTHEELRSVMTRLVQQGAHNINLVNPSHFTHALVQTLDGWSPGVPIVYNSGGYDSTDSLRRLEGKVDVFLPDLKYMDAEPSRRYSSAPDYFETAAAAIMEMVRQAGPCMLDDQGLIRRGVIVRHLILPGHYRESQRILTWIRDYLPAVKVSVMCQYVPCADAVEYPELNRRLTRFEYEKVLDHLDALGITDGYVQERSSASTDYIPDFDLQGVLAEPVKRP